jgi:hypothetical protein
VVVDPIIRKMVIKIRELEGIVHRIHSAQHNLTARGLINLDTTGVIPNAVIQSGHEMEFLLRNRLNDCRAT